MLKFTVWEWISVVLGFWLLHFALVSRLHLAPVKVALPATANHLAVGLMPVILSVWELNLWELSIGASRKAQAGLQADPRL